MIERTPRGVQSPHGIHHSEADSPITSTPRFEDCIGIIVKAARPYLKFASRYGMTRDDIFQVASLEVFLKLPNFDPNIAKLTTFLNYNIRGAIRKEFRDRGRLIHLPRGISEGITKIRNDEEILAQKLRRLPNDQELSDQSDIPLEQVRDIRIASYSYATNPTSLSQRVGSDDYHSDGTLVVEPYTKDSDFEESVIDKSLLSGALASLTDQERKAIQLYYGMENGKTFSQFEIADIMGSYQVNISRILRRARDKMAAFLKQINFDTPS